MRQMNLPHLQYFYRILLSRLPLCALPSLLVSVAWNVRFKIIHENTSTIPEKVNHLPDERNKTKREANEMKKKKDDSNLIIKSARDIRLQLELNCDCFSFFWRCMHCVMYSRVQTLPTEWMSEYKTTSQCEWFGVQTVAHTHIQRAQHRQTDTHHHVSAYTSVRRAALQAATTHRLCRRQVCDCSETSTDDYNYSIFLFREKRKWCITRTVKRINKLWNSHTHAFV